MYSVIRCCGNRLFNYGNIAKVCFVFLVVSTICVIEGRARRRYPNDRNVFIYLQFLLSTSFTDVCLTFSALNGLRRSGEFSFLRLLLGF